MEKENLTMGEVLEMVRDEFRQKSGWDFLDAKKRILELFQKNGIPVSKYKPYMCNNVLPGISLK